MPCLDIPASRSLTVASSCENGNINDKYIYIGNKCSIRCISYLYFNISSIPGNIKNMSATLVLSKKPISYCKDNDSKCNKNKLNKMCTEEYKIQPLLDYFNSYTTYNNRPKYDCSIEKSFFINEKNVCDEVDITPIVSTWISGKIPNKGLMLYGEKKMSLIKFFSVLNKDTSVIPFIRVYFEVEKCFIPMTELSCTWSLFPPLKERKV